MRRVSWEGGPSAGSTSKGGEGDDRGRRADRGISSVLAVVLLMGIVAVGVVSIVLVGSAGLTSIQDTAEDQRVETVFLELSNSVNSVAFGHGGSEEVNFDIRTKEGAVRHDDTGRIVVYTESRIITNETFGSLEYNRDGTTYAYQAGGVWRGKGADARMVSSPTFDYHDSTLNVPIPVVTGDQTVSSGSIDVRQEGERGVLNDTTLVQGELVTVEITSDYYGGWADYLRANTNEAAITVDHANETVIVTLGQPVVDGTFSEGVFATGGDVAFGGGNSEIDGDVKAEGTISNDSRITGNTTENAESDLRELDDVIETKITEGRNDSDILEVDPEGSTMTLEDGKTYYDDDGFTLNSGDELSADLSSGNVTLIVNGSISLDKGDIVVDNGTGDSAFRIYSNGNFGMKNSEAGATNEPEYFQLYGTSEMQVAVTGGGSTTLYGTVYAPRDGPVLEDDESNVAALSNSSECDGWDTCVATGNSGVVGAIIAGPTKVGQSTEIVYDSDLRNVEPSLQLDQGLYPPPITYLHVSIHQVNVSESGSRASLASPGVPSSVEGVPTGSVGSDAPSALARPAERV